MSNEESNDPISESRGENTYDVFISVVTEPFRNPYKRELIKCILICFITLKLFNELTGLEIYPSCKENKT